MALDKLNQWIDNNLSSRHTAYSGKSHSSFSTHYKKSPFVKTTYPKPIKQASTHHPSLPSNEKEYSQTKNFLKVISLGGLNEVGKNMMAIEYCQEIIIIDMGFQFPEEDMLGIDFVIPDISYLNGKEKWIRGVFITHGHLDHIGAIPYLIEKIGSPPVYATKLTLELIYKRNREFQIRRKPKFIEIDPIKPVKTGPFFLDFYRVNHSIPDCIAISVSTAAGTIVHTGDFKFDYTPADGIPADFAKLASLSKKNVSVLFSDSTNAQIPGHSISEEKIGENLDMLIKSAKGRVIIASFASLIGRIQQIINSAAKYHRRVYISGRSMMDNIEIAMKLGYLKLSHGEEIHQIRRGGRHVDDNSLILTTGSQGETVSGLGKMAKGEHDLKIRKGDTVILSSSPIMNNERAISRVMNSLCSLGARVISNKSLDVHVSGHGKQEDLKMMISLVNPAFLAPIHGELFMRMGHAELGKSLGMKDENIIIMHNGSMLFINKNKAFLSKTKLESKYILVEGPGITDSGSQILMERQILSENGVIVILLKINNSKLISDPEVYSRGFMYMGKSQKILSDISLKTKDGFNNLILKDPCVKTIDIKNYIRLKVETFVHNLTGKNPMVIIAISS